MTTSFRRLAPAAGALILLSLGATACHNSTQLVGQCTADSDCAQNFHCGLTGPFQGYCLCSNDQACPQDGGPAFCNPAGQCQVKEGCETDADCQGNAFCDLTLSLCVAAPACGSDLDCNIGDICAPASSTCTPGCHTNGDCPIDVPCVCGNGAECICPLPDAGGVDPATYDNALCEVGTCNAGTCANDTTLCPYNDLCVGSDGGLSTCEVDPRTDVLCRNCTTEPGSATSCGTISDSAANFCLTDLLFNNEFCGVDCSQGQSCPSGYECDDIVLLTQSECTRDQDCQPTGTVCDTDGGVGDAGSCPSDSRCAGNGATGQCAGYCIMGEDQTTGFCSCVTDADCGTDTCDDSTNLCHISQQPCDPAVTAICTAYVSCVDFGGQRGCFVGRNCAPTHGLKCPLTQSQ